MYQVLNTSSGQSYDQVGNISHLLGPKIFLVSHSSLSVVVFSVSVANQVFEILCNTLTFK